MDELRITFARDVSPSEFHRRPPSAPPCFNGRFLHQRSSRVTDPYLNYIYSRHDDLFSGRMLAQLRFIHASLPGQKRTLEELPRSNEGILGPDIVEGVFRFTSNQDRFTPAWVISTLTKISHTFFEALSLQRACFIARPRPYHSILTNVQHTALATLRHLVFSRQLTWTEAAIGFQIITSFEQGHFPEDFSSSRLLLDRIARVFHRSIYGTLPDLFPSIFGKVEGSSPDLRELDCLRFGFPPGTVPTLVQNWEVALCPDAEMRKELKLKTTNDVRTAFLNAGARMFTWLIRPVAYPKELDLTPFYSLPRFGFILVGSPQEGDLVLYMDETLQATHMGTFVEKNTVRSRWDGLPEMLHPIDGLPRELQGTHVAFFRYRPKEIENQLILWVCQTVTQIASEHEAKKIAPVILRLERKINRHLLEIADEKGLYADLDEFFNEAATRQLQRSLVSRLKDARTSLNPREHLLQLQWELSNRSFFNAVIFPTTRSA